MENMRIIPKDYPIIPELFLILFTTYYSKNYSGIMYSCLLLNIFDAMYTNPNVTLDVFSVHTGIVVLLRGHCTKLPRSTTLVRKKDERISSIGYK